MKILMVRNTAWYLYSCQLPLARLLRAGGHEVVMVAPWDPYADKLQAEGFRWIDLRLVRGSLSPLWELMVLLRLIKIYRRERPAIVHHFTIKCVLYGTIAARLCGVRLIINSITGLGYVFSATDRLARLLRPGIETLYRLVLNARRVKLIFQNPDDLQVFTRLRLVDPPRAMIVLSTGVDLERFCPQPQMEAPDGPPVVLFAARLIAGKGVREFVQAAQILKQRGVQANFLIAGRPDPGNPAAMPQELLDQWQQASIVKLLGQVEPIDDLLARATLIALPTHGGEGVPRILLEAAAMGKPIVASAVPGCREIVIDGVNGVLTPARDVGALADAMERLLGDPALCSQMGRAGRTRAEDCFSDDMVARQTLSLYEGWAEAAPS